MTKVFMQRQGDHDFYMFPGGRLEVHETAEIAILRELEEELGIQEEVKLKFISENFIQFPNLKYHEIGFYFVVKIDEDKYNYHSGIDYDSKDEMHDGKSKFEWIDIGDLDKYQITPSYMKEKLIDNNIYYNDNVEHLVYREYKEN